MSATQEDKYFTTNKIYMKIFNSKDVSNYGRCEHHVERSFRTLEGENFRGRKVRFIGQFYNSLLMMLSSLSWHDHFLNFPVVETAIQQYTGTYSSYMST